MADQKKEEEWGPIEGFSNYEISNRGKIRSKTRKVWHKGSKTHMKLRGKLMRQRWNKICKCYFLDLIDDNGCSTILLCRMIHSTPRNVWRKNKDSFAPDNRLHVV